MKLPLLIVSLTFICFVTANCQNTAIKRPKVGVVLSGGGAKGLAHIGVLKVLEEAGIPIDYIGGTSMGSIVGGLYALGYSTHDLDSIVHAVDWDELLTDHIARQNQSMVEKDEDVKYLVSFPIKGTKISLPSGIVAGQNISALLDQLCSPAYSITNFSKFPVPFLCVATNIETGQPVILKSGNLAQAMRASMAIPTIFTPEEINGQLLLDGGLIDNFPVKAVKDMGADIIIGIDVGFKYYSKDQLKSIVRIIEQSIFMHSREKNQESRKMCDVLIVPDFGEFNSSSFSSPDSLIAIGERAAREKISQIDSVAQLFKSFKIENTRQSLAEKANSKFNIQKIEIRGLNKIPQNFLVNKLTFGVPSKVTTNDIDKYIDILYGTRFFERITYQFEPMDGGVKLVFDVIEKNANYFRVGLHYDSDFKTTLMLNTTFRNLFYRGSKITLNLALGDNPSFTGIFYKNTGWRPSNSYFSRSKLLPDYGLKIQTRRLEVYGYENDKRIASFNFGGYSSDFFLQANISNKRAVGLGFGIDYTTISDRINYGIPVDTENLFMNVYFYTQKDSYDESFFPHKGSKIQGEVKYYKGASKSVKNTDFFLGTLRMDRYIALGRKISLAPGIYIGTTYGSGIPYQYHFYLGGLGGNYLRGLVPFTGLQFMQRSNLHTWVGQFNIQWEIFKDNYVILKSNIGKTTADRKNLLVWNDILAGAGISYGYRSPIGPMELSFMLSNKNTDISTFINIGYWF